MPSSTKSTPSKKTLPWEKSAVSATRLSDLPWPQHNKTRRTALEARQGLIVSGYLEPKWLRIHVSHGDLHRIHVSRSHFGSSS